MIILGDKIDLMINPAIYASMLIEKQLVAEKEEQLEFPPRGNEKDPDIEMTDKEIMHRKMYEYLKTLN